MRVEDLQAYEIVEKRRIPDLDSDSYVLQHKKTGARVALLSNTDENKVFYIGFRTPPTDSTGVAHIIEHTVLCGSRDFPIKDPFIELAKGSLNTFLNAMTYPDKTMYPVASCNDADFQNLMHVYLDAVFYPNIYKTEKIFRQEGWHYEMETADDPLTINGVVYNEMKGAFSSPDDVLSRQILNSLFPDTTYAIESGGDPENIPDLTYEQYLDFHRRYYHPSNSYIYLYGDMDMAEKLDYLDKEYLSHFEKLAIDSEIPMQKPFEQPKELHDKYSIMEEESEEAHTYLSYNTCVGTSLDPELYIAFDVLDYALCSAPGAVLKKALIDKGIGEDVYSEYENGIRQPYFSIIAKNADLNQKDEFLATIRQVLAQQVKDGLDKKALMAALNTSEFKYREADFGRFPKGLLYGLQMMDSWLYDDKKPWIHIEAGETFRKLKEKVNTHYFEDLIETYLLDNPHSTVVILEPEKGLTEKKDAVLTKRLADYKNSLSNEEIQKIVEETAALKAYQEAPDDPEDLKKIPLLTREDMKKDAETAVNEMLQAGSTPVLFHDIFTNGICYVNFVFDMKNVPEALFPYAGLLRTILGLVDTENYSYADLNNEINIRTGGISGSVGSYPDHADPDKFTTTFEINAKVLAPALQDAFALVQEILLTSKFDDVKRIKEILDEKKARMQADMMGSGHLVAANRALSYISSSAAVSDQVNGLGAYRLVEELDNDYSEETHKALVQKLTELSHVLFRKENLLMDLTCSRENLGSYEKEVQSFAEALFDDAVQTGHYVPAPVKKNEAFQTSGQVQYVALAGNFRKKGLPYTGALNVLRVMMGYDYLWTNIRVKGGAYGCMSSYSRSGNAYFVTYRDPHLKRSVQVFKEASKYLREFEADERTMTQYVIGAVGTVDTPKTPNAKGGYGLTIYMTGTTKEELQQARDEMLQVSVSDIRKLADYVDAFIEDDAICCVGGSEKIAADRDLFERVEQLVK